MGLLRGGATVVVLALAVVGGLSIAGVDVGAQARDVQVDPAVLFPTLHEGNATATPTPSDAERTEGVQHAAVREAFYTRLNEFRRANGRRALSHGPALHRAAKAHSEDMAARGYFSHVSPEGEDWQDRLRAAGGRCSRGGENLAQTWWRRETAGPSGGTLFIDSERELARAIFEQWRTSPEGHRRLLLLQGATRAGLGIAVTDSGRVYATLVVC